MKKRLMIAAGVALLTLAACKDKAAEDNSTHEAIATEVDNTTTAATDTTAPVQPEDVVTQNETITIKGEVTAIANGKDGYTATIKDMDGKLYDVVISIPNMKDPKNFRRVNTGDKIKVTGEHYMVGDRHTIKAETF
ncbi:OB-fold nucleic acid binding domain-containing protein [Flavobacterium sp. RHBU_24]|uniref:OB-fold nucleic acid binding domain-containing protein n=1 Tax=Flavobacterium sp. RHBU_24 TaxID=3391185 RepID=UPI0039849EFE